MATKNQEILELKELTILLTAEIAKLVGSHAELKEQFTKLQAPSTPAPLPAAPAAVVVPHCVDPSDKDAIKAFYAAKKAAKLAAKQQAPSASDIEGAHDLALAKAEAAERVALSAEQLARREAMAAAKAAAIASGKTVKV